MSEIQSRLETLLKEIREGNLCFCPEAGDLMTKLPLERKK